ncbi:MAG: hypothetical protein ACXVJA_05205 [Acidimicrobiia bacterium]
MAAALWAGSDGLVSGAAAGALWRLDGVVRPDRIGVLFSAPERRRSRVLAVSRSSDLIGADRADVGPIPVTSALRTVLDLAAELDARRLEVAVEDALRRGLLTTGQLRWRLAMRAGRGVPGSATLAALAHRADVGRTDSGWEVRTEQALVAGGLPVPVRQLAVPTRLGILHADLGYPGPPVVVFEYDSDRWHSGVARRRRDVSRRNALRAAGCSVIEVTSSMLRESV